MMHLDNPFHLHVQGNIQRFCLIFWHWCPCFANGQRFHVGLECSRSGAKSILGAASILRIFMNSRDGRLVHGNPVVFLSRRITMPALPAPCLQPGHWQILHPVMFESLSGRLCHHTGKGHRYLTEQKAQSNHRCPQFWSGQKTVCKAHGAI